MNDKDRQNYLVKLVKNNYDAETQQKMISDPSIRYLYLVT